MIVVSTFDGIAAGYEALKRIGREPDLYFASEIDKYAIRVARARHPKLIPIGCVEQAHRLTLPMYPDLLIGGSPCQGFSRSGDREGFDHDHSRLFWEFVRLRDLLKPKNFLLENVNMRKAWLDVISKALGVEPILINSKLVSAQSRERHYWTDIPGVEKPLDRRIFLPNIAEYGIDTARKKLIDPELYFNLAEFKNAPLPVPMNFFLRRSEEGRAHRREGFLKKEGDRTSWKLREFAPRLDLKVNCLVTMQTKEHLILDETRTFRRLSVLEMERLQTLPDGYTDVRLSDSRRIELIGNGWTVDVIAHILNYLPK